MRERERANKRKEWMLAEGTPKGNTSGRLKDAVQKAESTEWCILTVQTVVQIIVQTKGNHL